MVAYLREQWRENVPGTQGVGLVGKDCHFKELCNFMLAVQKEKAVLYTARTAEETTCVKSLLEVSTTWAERTAQKNRIVELTRLLAKGIAERKRNVAEKKHQENVVVSRQN